MEPAQSLILQYILADAQAFLENRSADSKTALQDLVQKDGSGSGRSKQEAEQAAAAAALGSLAR